jgi:hypothetical protein
MSEPPQNLSHAAVPVVVAMMVLDERGDRRRKLSTAALMCALRVSRALTPVPHTSLANAGLLAPSHCRR